MKLHFLEVTNGFNWGKFGIGRFTDDELAYESVLEEEDQGVSKRLVAGRGWGHDHVWFLDLQTGEGVFLRVGGYAKADLMKHRVWVCPMFEPMLEWAYRQNLSDLDALPSIVRLTEEEAPSAMHGYRRQGPQ